jgi:hypothetical protein
MTEPVVIKTVGGKEIKVRTSSEPEGWVMVFVALFTILGFSLLFYYWVLRFEIAGTVLGFGFLIITMLLILTSFHMKWSFPTYEVSVHKDRTSITRIIRSTTPESDQTAICKAAKELEDEILAETKKQEDLVAIAAKCR